MLLALLTLLFASLIMIRYSTLSGVPASVVPVATATLTLVGFAEVAFSPNTTRWYAIGLAGLLLGYALRAPRSPAPPPDRTSWNLNSSSLWFAVIVVSFGTAWHFRVTGVPILSPDVETARFNFSSGFFGIPSRLYLFGAPLVWLLAVRHTYMGGPEWISRTALFVLVLSRVASGFKGALVELVVLAFFAAALRPQGIPIGGVVRRYVVPGAVAIVFAAFMFGLYQTSESSGLRADQALLARTTTGSAIAGVVSIESGEALLPTSAVANDIKHFTRKYLVGGDPYSFAYSERVSSAMYGTPLLPTSFIVPVTVGAFAELFHDIGSVGAILGMTLVGALLGQCERRARRTSTWRSHLLTLTLFLALYGYLTKGGLVYNAINWGGSVVIVIVVIAASALFVRQPSQRRSGEMA